MSGSETSTVSGIAAFARQRRRWLIGAALGIVVYAALGFLLAPWLVNKVAAQTAGLRIRFMLFSLSVPDLTDYFSA